MGLTLTEHVRIAAMTADRRRRDALSRLLSSSFLRWRYGASAIDQVLIVPQELRTVDPSFWSEVDSGHFGLAGKLVALRGVSPFAVSPPSVEWQRALHGFGWLRHLASSDEPEAYDKARNLVLDWIAKEKVITGPAYEPAVLARRIISWICQAHMLFEGADAREYVAITRSLGRQIVHLNGCWRMAPDGYQRLLCLEACVLADLAIAGHNSRLEAAENHLAAELERQFLPDGGHISRNAAVLVEVILDLLPLSKCFKSRGRAAPDVMEATIRRAIAHLKFMRLGDGMLARFNGVGVPTPAGLATVIPYSDVSEPLMRNAPASGYARLQRGQTIVIMDAGPPPPIAVGTEAQAGCLSFEMSSGKALVFVNGGMPSMAARDWAAVARATASHNTLCLGEKSSSRLLRNPSLQRLVDGMPIRMPATVLARTSEDTGAAVIKASHDGYLDRFKLVHWRTMSLSDSGRELVCVDRLAHPHDKAHMARALPFAIHFHLHPSSRCDLFDAEEADMEHCVITLADGQRWVFSAEGAEISIEESIFFPDSAGPCPTLQIVLRAAATGEHEVRWVAKADRTG